MDRVIGRRLFTDSLERDGYEEASGRQDVLGPDERRFYGHHLARNCSSPSDPESNMSVALEEGKEEKVSLGEADRRADH
jgi:hypothetical protein